MNRPPTEIEKYARRFGYDVEYTDLPPAIGGHVLPDGKRLCIVVNRTWPAPEQDFTIAHEVVHCRLHYGQKLVPLKIIREFQANSLAWVIMFWIGKPETFAACLERHPLALPQAMLGLFAGMILLAEDRLEPYRNKIQARFRKQKP